MCAQESSTSLQAEEELEKPLLHNFGRRGGPLERFPRTCAECALNGRALHHLRLTRKAGVDGQSLRSLCASGQGWETFASWFRAVASEVQYTMDKNAHGESASGDPDESR